jgi:Uma2 family endonuclease
MAYPAKKQPLSVEEFLAMEEKSDVKHEYYKGEIFAFAGASINHNQVIFNFSALLHKALKNSKCRGFSNDLRVRVQEKDFFTYPDILVICGKPEFFNNRTDTVTNPVLIIEVLSDSTKNYDRGEKFEFYRSIPSLKNYILVDQYKIHLEHFSKASENKWVLTEYFKKSDALTIPDINVNILLEDIYDRVDFKTA